LQATLRQRTSSTVNKTALWVYRGLMALSLLLMLGGGVWFVAITGIVGHKDWDFNTYGLNPVLTAVSGGFLLALTLIYFFTHPGLKAKSKPVWHDIKRDRWLYLLILPGIIAVFVFRYMPMYGIVIGFKKYRTKAGILFSQWVGMENFARFFRQPAAKNVIGNTLFIGVTQLLITFPVPIILALLLNELKSNRFRRSIQSVIYLPHFVSWVIMHTLLFSLFSVTSGLINKIIMSMGGKAINLLSDPNNFYGLIYGSSIWKEAGWGTIIYMAAIAGVDQEMYEAAYIDGANRFQRCRYITLPAISFSITTMLILSVGSIMGANFDQIMNLRSVATQNTVAQVIDTYVYDMGVDKGQHDLSTAIGLFQQVVNCILLFASNMVVKRLSGEGFF
jgi:putative aldouronate transport system permease protein